MIVTCNDTECKYYSNTVCTAPAIDHTADRICINGRRKQEAEYKQLIRNNQPIDFKQCEKDVSN